MQFVSERSMRLRPFLLLLAAGCASPGSALPSPSSDPAPSSAAAAAAAAVVPDHRPDLRARHRLEAPRREQFVDSILALMTLEEKLGQLNQPGGPGADTGPAQRAGSEADVRGGHVGSFLGVHGAANTRSLQRIAVEETRLGIPLLFAHDVIHGFRTIFPVPLAEAASFDPEAVERASRIAAIEASAHGVTWTYAPMVDIARDPRWGRIVEGAGEDPYLGSAMAAARVRGFQGSDLAADNTILATAKHFVAYGAAEGGRDYDAADVPERTLREIYLPPFHAAVDAGVGSVMAAFNEVAGVPMHAHDGLIDGLLREEWGWDGILVSDYTGIMELLNHRVAADSAAAGALGLRAGVDVDMISRIYLRHGPSLVAEGHVEEGVIDDAVRRVLRAKYDLGLFEDPYRYADPARTDSLTMRPEFLQHARELARKSIVLLQNDPVNGTPLLPLRRDVPTIAVIGSLAADSGSALGSWAALGRPQDAVPILDGIRAAVSPDTELLYAPGAPVDSVDRSGFEEAIRIARAADVVVLVVGEHRDMSAEARNRADIGLPGVQQELVEAVYATGTPVVTVLTNGRPLAIPWLAENAPAILETWYLGVQMGPAVADVLFGDYNPAGRLPVTFPRTTGQVPIYYNHKSTGRPPAEDRYTSKYIDVHWTPQYPFGHGLSYTTFAYSAPRLSATSVAAADSLVVSVEVTNTGERAGDEVVQLYVRDEVASVTPAVRRLRGFRRIRLQPGETRSVSFTLHPRDLAFWNAAMQRVVEPGWFTVMLGGSSQDVQQARFQVTGPVFELGP
ncbi:MAG TPA: glycoside hydrolase family 3 N-terminal domain-containing protein [Longimicrobiales bacterium]|nr:glycoside hydrolase family 3 N-terminal domain-containing protein [Longimicrobiales bacterium]